MRALQLLLLLCILLSPATLSLARDPVRVRREIRDREVYGNGRIFDITHEINPNMPTWDSKDGLGQFIWLVDSMKNGSDLNSSQFKLSTHTGTHIDAPGHVYEEYYEAGYNVNSLDLAVLNGPAMLVDVPRDSNITASCISCGYEVLEYSQGVRRVLFRTLNTDRKLMFKKEFDSSYVAFMEDGAKWLVENTDIKLIGVDYLSSAAYVNTIPPHLIFLKKREIILVEGLKLDNITAGHYNVHCLPLRMIDADGSPARCILIK
ncbi:unnamed protein product [Dovyalis caffra]|uniref:Cyclase n=1 Tax=Dovyalis caffra TaxID=77055 RepID=A0AAV1RC46_9ROSI|nr:unnamed protein product [Dovyalis caffra]